LSAALPAIHTCPLLTARPCEPCDAEDDGTRRHGEQREPPTGWLGSPQFVLAEEQAEREDHQTEYRTGRSPEPHVGTTSPRPAERPSLFLPCWAPRRRSTPRPRSRVQPRAASDSSFAPFHHNCRRVTGRRLASTLSTRRPSRSITSKRQPETSTCSPTAGRWPRCASTKPAAVW
jgi:hypothetical protein